MKSSLHRSVPVYDPKSNQYLGFLDMLDIISYSVNFDPKDIQEKAKVEPCSTLIGFFFKKKRRKEMYFFKINDLKF